MFTGVTIWRPARERHSLGQLEPWRGKGFWRQALANRLHLRSLTSVHDTRGARSLEKYARMSIREYLN